MLQNTAIKDTFLLNFQRILKKRSLSTKKSLIIIRNVSWVTHFWRIMWHWRLELWC